MHVPLKSKHALYFPSETHSTTLLKQPLVSQQGDAESASLPNLSLTLSRSYIKAQLMKKFSIFCLRNISLSVSHYI